MLRKMNLILAVAAMMILSSFVAAQKDDAIQKEVESKMVITAAQGKEAEKGGDRESHDMSGIPIGKCPLHMHSTIMGGINDNLSLTPPADPMFVSPNMTMGKPLDDQTVNSIFAYSFDLRKHKPCDGKVCRAELLIRVCNRNQDYWLNDRIYVGTADSGTFVASIFAGNIWSGFSDAGKCKNMMIPIPNGSLVGMNYLDILMQDDSSVDYLQLDLDF